jgi:TolB-like protein/DNA-binding winged helix-turn-helix (wHTH) protein/Flp pilus assembly protein TadD
MDQITKTDYEFEGFRLDSNLQVLICPKGDPVSLPSRAFATLRYLVERSGEIVEKSALMAEVWPRTVVAENNLNQCILTLRKVLGESAGDRHFILTVPGRGFKFVAPVTVVPQKARHPHMTTPLAISPRTADQSLASRSTPVMTEAVGQGSTPFSHSVPSSRLGGTGKRLGAAATVLIAIGVGTGLALHYWPSHHTPQPITVPMVAGSIAVLPFVDMSEKKDQEYFGDGMAEEIIDLLVKIPGLKVIGRTSSFQFKGKSVDLRSIASQLGTAYVLEGSVRKSDDRLRVTAQLIDSSTGTNVWSQTYDQGLSNVLKMQDEIAIALVRELKIEVSPLPGFEGRPALRNTEAYALYLRGLHDSDPTDQQGFERVRSEFQRALDLDPTFAQAAGMLAATYSSGALNSYIPPDVGFEQARDAAQHAIKLDPNNPIAYSVLADIHDIFDWDWAAADREFAHTLALAPNNPIFLQNASRHALTMGRFDEALNLTTASLALDPLDVGGYYWLSTVQLRRGRMADAEAAIRRALDLAPTFPFGPYALGVVLLARSQPQAALTAIAKEPIEAAQFTGSAMAYFALGRRAESDASLAQMLKGYSEIPFGIATIYAFRGESDQAFKWLDRAYERKDPFLHRIKFAPEFDKLHDDPRYKAFLKKMNFP